MNCRTCLLLLVIVQCVQYINAKDRRSRRPPNPKPFNNLIRAEEVEGSGESGIIFKEESVEDDLIEGSGESPASPQPPKSAKSGEKSKQKVAKEEQRPVKKEPKQSKSRRVEQANEVETNKIEVKVPMLEEIETKYTDEQRCAIDLSGLPSTGLLEPYNQRLTSYDANSLLVVNMAQCRPLAVYFRSENSDKVYCQQLSFSGDYPIKCIRGWFRHGLQTRQRVHKASCGQCHLVPFS